MCVCIFVHTYIHKHICIRTLSKIRSDELEGKKLKAKYTDVFGGRKQKEEIL